MLNFLICYISNESVEAKVKGEWAKGITLENAAINFDKRRVKTLRYDRSVEIRIKILVVFDQECDDISKLAE